MESIPDSNSNVTLWLPGAPVTPLTGWASTHNSFPLCQGVFICLFLPVYFCFSSFFSRSNLTQAWTLQIYYYVCYFTAVCQTSAAPIWKWETETKRANNPDLALKFCVAAWSWNMPQFCSRDFPDPWIWWWLSGALSKVCSPEELWNKDEGTQEILLPITVAQSSQSKHNLCLFCSYHSASPVGWQHRTDRTRLAARVRGGHRKRWFQKASKPSSPEDSSAGKGDIRGDSEEEDSQKWSPCLYEERCQERNPSFYLDQAQSSRTFLMSTHMDRLHVWANQSPFLIPCDWPKMFTKRSQSWCLSYFCIPAMHSFRCFGEGLCQGKHLRIICVPLLKSNKLKHKW